MRLQKEPYKGRRTGSIIHWKPDDEVFTDIDVPGSYYSDAGCRQARKSTRATSLNLPMKRKGPCHRAVARELVLPERHRGTMWQK